MKKKIIYTIVGIAILAIIITVLVVKHNRKENSSMSSVDQNQAQSQTSTPPSNPANPPVANQITLPQGYSIPDDCKDIDFKNSVAVLNTSMGTIKFQMYTSDAPLAVVNFDCLIKRGYYNGVIFHRILKDLAIQGGDPTGTGRGGQSAYGSAFADELNPNAPSYKTGYAAGTLAMANAGPNTNGSQFFIIPTDQAKAAFAPNYTIFGHVISGMDVVLKMNAVAINPVNGPTDGSPVTPITITSATLEVPAAK